MKQTKLLDRAEEALLKCLLEVPFVKVEVMRESKRLATGPDLLLQVKTRASKRTLMVDVKSVGQPRVVREATNQLARFKEQLPDAYGVVMAPYISPEAAAICRKEGLASPTSPGIASSPSTRCSSRRRARRTHSPGSGICGRSFRPRPSASCACC